MDDKEIIVKISLLKEIKPRQDWVILTRSRIAELESQKIALASQKRPVWGIVDFISALRYYLEKPAFAMPFLALLVSAGLVWHMSTQSLPGDTLYLVKAAVERVPFTFSSQEQKPFLQIELAQKRLDDLKKIAESNNKVKNLPSAIKEFEANVSGVSESLAQIVENQPEKALQAGREIVQLQKEKSEIEKILGTTIGGQETQELEDATKLLVENELADLEKRLLTTEQQALFEAAKTAYQAGDYQTALETIWALVNQEG